MSTCCLNKRDESGEGYDRDKRRVDNSFRTCFQFSKERIQFSTLSAFGSNASPKIQRRSLFDYAGQQKRQGGEERRTATQLKEQVCSGVQTWCECDGM